MIKKIFYTVILTVLLISFWGTEKVNADYLNEEEEDIRQRIVTRATDLAIKDMQGVYSWGEYRSCSTFASTYLSHLSFPVNSPGKYLDHPDPFPFSSTTLQVEWVERNYPQYLKTDTLENFLNQKMRKEIPVGSVVYMQAPIGHNGYNTWYHVVVLAKNLSDQTIFAEISAGRKAAYRTFEEVVRFYSQIGTKPYKTGENTQKNLIIAWFDPLEIINKGGLWYKTGKVIPGQIFDKFDLVMTVNVFDGTTAVFSQEWKNNKLVWVAERTQGYDEYYAVIGRLLPANSTIGSYFYKERTKEVYDSDYGIYINGEGVFQHNWTPQLVGEIKSFQYISGFGGLNGGTDTAIITPLFTDKRIADIANSPFTVHRIPDVENQDMLLREDLLIKANVIEHKPIPQPNLNLSSGCINYDKTTWKSLKNFIQEKIDEGKKIGIVYSYPGFDQNLILKDSLYKSAFIGSVFFKWCPEEDEENINCDYLDRRKYRETYLDKKVAFNIDVIMERNDY